MAATDERAQPDYSAILTTISAWPMDQQLAIVRDILDVISAEAAHRPRRQPTLQRASGLLAGPWPAPTDEEVARLIDEQRTEKYS